MTTLFQPLRVLARHGDPLMAAGIQAALMEAPGVEVVKAGDSSSFPDAEVVICATVVQECRSFAKRRISSRRVGRCRYNSLEK